MVAFRTPRVITLPETKNTNKNDTPAKFNIATEKGWLEDAFPFGIAYF